MALEMRARCERCGGSLSTEGEAYICSYECTFCPECFSALRGKCPNCGNELVRRPRRMQTAEEDEPKLSDSVISLVSEVE